MLIQGLPGDSATWREDYWSAADELAASQLELTDLIARMLITALTRKKVPGKPLKVKRPGQDEPKEGPPIMTDRAAIARWFATNR